MQYIHTETPKNNITSTPIPHLQYVYIYVYKYIYIFAYMYTHLKPTCHFVLFRNGSSFWRFGKRHTGPPRKILRRIYPRHSTNHGTQWQPGNHGKFPWNIDPWEDPLQLLMDFVHQQSTVAFSLDNRNQNHLKCLNISSIDRPSGCNLKLNCILHIYIYTYIWL